MRRSARPSKAPFLSSGEMARLGAMVVCLALLCFLMAQARNPQLWRWFTSETSSTGRASVPPAKVQAGPSLPKDLGADETKMMEQELAVLTDRTPLTPPEMFAYRHLLRWSRSQSDEELRAAAREGVAFQQLFEQPQPFRGQLMRLKLHVREVLNWSVEERDLIAEEGVHELFELRAWNEESAPFAYLLIADRLPPGWSTGRELELRGEFVGYFLKVMSYEDHQGQTRGAPLLIGRLVGWDLPQEVRPSTSGSSWWYWGLLAVAALWLGGRIVVMAWRLRRQMGSDYATKGQTVRPTSTDLDQWLEAPTIPPSEGKADDTETGE